MLKNQVTMDNAALHVEETKQVMIVSIKLNITKANMGNIMVGSTGLDSQPPRPATVMMQYPSVTHHHDATI